VRCLKKIAEPAVLATNHVQWLVDYRADKTNTTNRYRYRHAEIKLSIRLETGDKCVYCESKVGHNTPGDIEHKIASSVDDSRHFIWSNLTLACGECNRRKGILGADNDFLDPYVDDIDEVLIHLGPLVWWKTGEMKAEITVKTLKLHSWERSLLILRKIEKLAEVATLLGRLNGKLTGALLGLIEGEVREMTKVNAEYSGMVRAALIAWGRGDLVG
jgi:hypothetical protein